MTSVLSAWLSAAQQLPLQVQSRLLLRGSLLTAALVQGGRTPADVDYLVTGDFEPQWVTGVVQAVPLPGLEWQAQQVIWGETAFPGVRCFLQGERGRLQVDFAFGDPLSLPPERREVAGVPGVLSCTPEDLWGWKLHGLTEFGRGRWRGKDLYDLARLSQTPLRQDFLPRAVGLAFSSRGLPLAALTDFMTRPGWGEAVSTQRKWRTFVRRSSVQAEFLDCRAQVRAQVRRLWPALDWTPEA